MKKTLICMSLALLGAQAMAADAGWYIGGDISSTKFKADGETDTKAGVGFYGGYNFNRQLAVEGAIRRLGTFDCDYGRVTFDDCGAHSISASFIGRAPIGDNFSLYGRLGFARNSLDARDGSSTTSVHSTKALLGFGGEVLIKKHFGLRAEFVNLGNNKINGFSVKIQQFNVGFHYVF